MAPGSPPDPLDRDQFYTPDDSADAAGVDGDEDGDDDYELEPVDPDVIASEQRRTEEAVAEATSAIDIDEVYREQAEGENLDDFLRDFKFRFQIKHLLMATAAFAVFMSLVRVTGSGFAALSLAVLALLVGAHAFLAWRDRKRDAMLAARREALDARNRARAAGEPVEGEFYGPLSEEEESDEPKESGPPLRIRFTLKEVLIAMTVASVTLAVLSYSGTVAAVLGLLAIAGFVAFAAGVTMPPLVVLGWWITMVLYIVVSVVGWMAGGDG